MQFIKKSIFTLCLFSGFLAQAQNVEHNHAPHRGCSVGLETGAQLKERMFSQREDARLNALVAQRSNATTYIPVAVTSVSNTNGVGHANASNLLAMICDMNNDYADQNIVFYLKDSIRYLRNDALYNDAFSNSAIYYMSSNKVANAVNIYVSPTVGNSVASYYMPSGDFVFIITSEANGTSNTATHEVGHFFSLNHTFYGWEGVSYHSRYNTTTTPTRIGGELVENVARTGTNKNCTNAADGFCDTPADYISDRWECPYIGSNGVIATDPLGVETDPDESNYMSYYFDACVIAFSAEQKAAIARDIARRGWSNNPAPAIMGNINIDNFTALSPINNVELLANGSNNISLSWEPLDNANMYMVYIDRLFYGQSVPPNLTLFTTGNHITFSSSLLETLPNANIAHEYRWYVRPMNSTNLCGANTTYNYFKTSLNGTQVAVEEFNAETKELGLTIMPNPIQNNQVRLQVSSYEAQEVTFRIFSADGRMVMQQNKQQLMSGENLLTIDLGQMSTGLYTLVVTDNKGVNKTSRFTVAGF